MKRAPNWTRREDAKLLDMKERGLDVREMRAHLPGRTSTAIASHLNYIGLSSARGPIAGGVRDRNQRLSDVRSLTPETKDGRTRPCLNCRRQFNSEGPHNRLCGNCRHETDTVFTRPASVVR